MATEKLLIFCLLVIISRKVLSQSCPSGCTCANQVLNCTGAGFSQLPSPVMPITGTGYNILDFSNNNIQSLPTGAFEDLPDVTEIILAGNQISAISPGAFSNLPALTTLNLKDNQLSTVDQSSFDRLSSLMSLQLDGNQIACDSSIDWLKDWSGKVSGDCTASGTITSYLAGITLSSVPHISFESASYTVVENEGPVSVVVVRKGPFSARLDIELTTSSLTATSGTDFTAKNGEVQTMDPWQTRIAVPISIFDDAEKEAPEALNVTLSVTARGEANQAIIEPIERTTLTIVDDESITTAAPTTMPEPEPTPEPTEKMVNATTKPVGKPSSSGPNAAAIAVPIVLIIIILVAVCVGYYLYRKKKEAEKVTAGVKYAAVQNQNSKVYSDVTAKA